MEIRQGFILCFLTISSLSFACHSMNGISKKAILRTLETSRKSQDLNVSPEESSEESREKDLFSKKDTTGFNGLLVHYVTETNESGDTSNISHSIVQLNTSQNLTPQALQSEYVGFKFINPPGKGSPRKMHPKFFALRLLHEPAMSVDEPGMKTERNSQASFTTVLSMRPPLNTGNSPAAPTTEQEENDKVNSDWGGECGLDDWKKCYNITVIGNPTEVHPQFPHDRKKNRQTRMDCFDTMEALDFPWLCLRNGWTVNRCHILCMSMCNRELLMTRKWEFYVLHEGPCKTK